MKRTAATILLLAGIGGCVSPASTGKTAGKPFNVAHKGMEAPGVVGSTGEPLIMTKMTKRAEAKSTLTKIRKTDTGIVQASATSPINDATVQQSAGFARIVGGGCPNGDCATPTGGHGGHLGGGHPGHGGGEPVDPNAYGPMGSHFGTYLGKNGIMPVPQMGPWGATAAIGAIGAGVPYGSAMNQRTSVRFVSPQGMRIGWFNNGTYTDSGLTAPANYNFAQGSVYRLKLSNLLNQQGPFYPTVEIMATTMKTMAFLSHNSVPLSFSEDDFARVNGGNMVVKVIYLPDPAFQDVAGLGGAGEIVSTQLEPGADPIVEANRRGSILAVIRLGNIDLENPNSPAMDAMPPGMRMAPAMMAPPSAPLPMMVPPAPLGASTPGTATPLKLPIVTLPTPTIK